MKTGERLRILREKNELTQSEVANYLKTSQSYYAQYENDRRPIPFERVVELSQLYNVSIDYIAGSTDDINRRPR
ncbi:MAG: helix-turn-helix domain-containing protein [Lachnospiraceae bacterium]|nr:helix-turn-helix domain-containing protein [Ruminococcus sp.]MCM1276205.1 helix-turn-helix domain-containing protein [Lachnospiraceae bacterium]